ncbi:hypothetical protein N7532_001192 [Penicillium argentinense]|uniref:Uncharacterized protein n=1 Tax=Penicillium argentinense TaxID=1131581 RepID=A0A9W9KM97_9EURO|nr:uncharacterized protein N7532_001192 [Penicillium argentinense]KAJ5110657.1 hypothetical protein N7532_001192 [Penicillium argentinense]
MKYNRFFLPNGQRIDLPPEWRITLYTENADKKEGLGEVSERELQLSASCSRFQFTTPTLLGDVMHLSSMSLPARDDMKPESAITRQIAMILWVTFLWYFQEETPSPHIPVHDESELPEIARATGLWMLKVKDDGLLRGKDRMLKLERMGLLATTDPSVGSQENGQLLGDMFISQRAFWQLDPRIYLFTLGPARFPERDYSDPLASLDSFGVGFPFGAGPHTSGTFMPSYYPPAPTQYTFTGDFRHPVRPRAPRQGEVFYTRFIPSGGQHLTFRIPVVPVKGSSALSSSTDQQSNRIGPNLCLDSELLSDVRLFHRWVNQFPTHSSLLQKGPLEVQLENLKKGMSSQSSFPALACWNSTAVGYFEIFWTLEDSLGRSVSDVGDWDRGIRFFIGDNRFDDSKSLALFLSSVVHYCWLADQRTCAVFVEARADNERLLSCLQTIGFYKESEINVLHEHAVIMKVKRITWLAPSV